MNYLITYQQKKILTHEILHPEDTAYNMLQGVKLEGRLNQEKLIEALKQLYAKERILRVQYEKAGSKIYQNIGAVDDINVSFERVTREQLKKRIREEKERPFYIFQESMTRFYLFQLDENEYFLLIVLHHSICDGWSLRPLSEKIMTLYMGKTYEVENDYLDYAQTQHIRDSNFRKNSEFWKCEMENKECRVDFTFDPAWEKSKVSEEGTLENKLDLSLCQKIKSRCKEYGITPFVFFYGCYSYLLHKYSNQEEITITIPFANRMDRRWSNTVGCFVNPFPMTFDYSHDLSVTNYLKEIFKSLVRGISKAEAEIDLQCNMAFTFQNFAKVDTFETDQLKVTPVKIYNSHNKFDIELIIQENEKGFTCQWANDQKRLCLRSMENIHGHFLNIVEEMLDLKEEQMVSNVEILHREEVKEQLKLWNQTDKIYPGFTNLKECIDEAAKKYSEYPAVQFEHHILTYKEFTLKTNGLIVELFEHQVQKGDIVAIQFERSLEMIIAIYAIVRSGCAYIPIAMDTPKNRVNYILKDSQAKLLLRHSSIGDNDLGCQVLNVDFDKLPVITTDMIQTMNQSEVNLMTKDVSNTDGNYLSIKGSDPAYVIYTSGSTGEPKGVINSNEGICNRLYWMQEKFKLQPGDAVLQKTPYTFDVSVWEFFWPLMFGGKLVVAEKQGHQNAAYLVKTIAEEQISFIHFVPSMLNIFLKNPNIERCKNLKTVICSGEELKKETVQRFYELLPVNLANLYGPTEAAVDVSCYCMEGIPGKSSVPIGKPIQNIKLYKLDKHKKLAPYQVPGELYISGVGLAKGYLNNPQLTAEKFIENQWEGSPYDRMYKTGDLVKYDEEGNLIYITRLDNQVKLNGQRIELQEIEDKMRAYSGIEEAIIIVDKNDFGEQYLIGFIVGQQQIHKDKLLEFLRVDLMEYMVPRIICQIDSLPLSANGKIDRRMLKDIYYSNVSTTYLPPRNFVETAVVEEMEKVLQRNGIGINDDYFTLGGNSLRIVDFIEKLNQKLGMDIPYHLLMKYPRIEEFARQVEYLRISGASELHQEISVEEETKTAIHIDHWHVDSKEKERVIFLTGSTGFLGNYLLGELLKEMGTTIFCLVREEEAKSAKEKIINNMKRIHQWKEQYRKRIHVLLGDLEAEKLGLGTREIKFLKEHASLLLHNGANVNFSLPYNQIRNANVESTRTILDILSQGRNKRMIYISTFSVFSEAANKKGDVSEKDYPKDVNNLTMGYTQSKMVSEQIIKQYADLGEDVTIVRLGRIIGNVEHSANKDIFNLLLKLCLQIKFYPQIEEYFDLLPVKTASKLIGRISAADKKAEPVYHLVNPNFMSIEEIGALLHEYSEDVVGISWAEWYQRCREEAEQGNELAKSVIVLLGKDFKGSHPKKIMMEHGKALLEECQIEIPSNEKILNNFLYNGGRKNGDE